MHVDQTDNHVGIGVEVRMGELDDIDRYMLVKSLMKSLDVPIQALVVMEFKIGDSISGVVPMEAGKSVREMLDTVESQPQQTAGHGLTLLKGGDLN
jgi:hypothetical protein